VAFLSYLSRNAALEYLDQSVKGPFLCLASTFQLVLQYLSKNMFIISVIYLQVNSPNRRHPHQISSVNRP